MTTPRSLRILVAGAFAGAALAGLAGCLDLSLYSEIAFPPAIPGLPADQPWVFLPVGGWVQDGEVRAEAVAACFSAGCGPQAAIGVFRATGQEAERLRQIADDPERLSRAVLRRPTVRTRRLARPVTSRLEVARFRDGAARGFSVRIARQDGSHPAYGAALVAEGAGALTIVLVVSPSEEGAKRLARETASQLI